MLLSELVKELQELLETQGDIAVVVKSQDEGFEAVNCTDYVYHDGASCLLID
ncbi:hypothetical protein [Pseudomonas kitaguniensis]|uniref:hypothetical protein n=1 Tax=Pseudomonas kitaguniensis TaxID=2607908 RepID=UPI003BA26919